VQEDIVIKRFVVEIGVGADLHGQDVTKAAQRAVQDAMSHCCLCGITEILQVESADKIHVKIKVGCPYPEQLKKEELVKLLPFGKATVEEVVTGGLAMRGMHVDALGEGDQIIVSVVSLTVCIEQ
jgi:uncharacterized protein (TIGR02058 family)